MKHTFWLSLMAVAAGAIGIARAQEAPPPPPDAGVTLQAAQNAAEELFLARLFARVQLSPPQAAQLVPVLDRAQTRLKGVDDTETAAVARLRSGAEQAL